jgi:hypothetical protein
VSSSWEGKEGEEVKKLEPPSYGELAKVFEAVIRTSGGRVDIYSGLITGLSGDLVRTPPSSLGECVRIETRDRAEGRWNPGETMVKNPGPINSQEELQAYADELFKAGVTSTVVSSSASNSVGVVRAEIEKIVSKLIVKEVGRDIHIAKMEAVEAELERLRTEDSKPKPQPRRRQQRG